MTDDKMAGLQAAKKRHTDIWFNAVRTNCSEMPEAHEPMNEASANVIRAYHEAYGEAWLVNVNLYDGDDRDTCIRQWDQGPIYNWCAGAVIPRFDQKLKDMILERDAVEGYNGSDDFKRVTAIEKRIHEELGGQWLIWA